MTFVRRMAPPSFPPVNVDGERANSERLLPIRIDAVAEPWEGITSVLVPRALTLAMAERFGAKLAPRFQYGEMKE